MIAPRRLNWLLHIVLALVAVAGVLHSGAAFDQPVAPRAWSTSAAPVVASPGERPLAIRSDAPGDRVAVRRACTTRVAWQRGSRRTQRVATSQRAAAERAGSTAFGTAGSGRAGARLSARRDGDRDDERLRALPTRAPPTYG